MKRSGAVKFPNSVQLFKFCQKVMVQQRTGGKVNDQEIGNILEFNPSDCSHWKRGEKSVRSVFALAKLAETLNVEASLIHDVAAGLTGLDEAFFEYTESREVKATLTNAGKAGAAILADSRKRIESFVKSLHTQSEFTTAPLYLPEVLRFFSFIVAQPTEMMDKLSRILRVKTGQYAIQFRKGDLKPQTRMSIAKDVAKIVLEAERARFPELGAANPALKEFEQTVFIANLLAPKSMLLAEMTKVDMRRNVVAELATLFWVPKSLVGFQMQDVLLSGERAVVASATAGVRDTQSMGQSFETR